jgi:hypothetical protein
MSDPTAAADFFTFRGDKISRLVIYGLAPR